MRNNKLLKNTIASFIYEIVAIICGFLLPQFILRAFGSEINGLVNSIMQFLGIISFLEFGVGAVIQTALYKPLAENDDAQISRIVVSGQRFFKKIAIDLVIYVLFLVIFYPFFVKQKFDAMYTITLILVISISSFAEYYLGIINRLLLVSDQKGYISYNVLTITLIMNTVVCLVLIKCNTSIHVIKLTTSLIYLLRAFVLAVYVKINYNLNWKIRYKREPIQQKWNGIAQHIAAVVLDGTDNIVLTIWATMQDVSIYAVYNLIIAGVKKIILSLTRGIQAVIGELWAKQERKQLKIFFGWVEWVIHTSTILIFGITMILILPFINIYTSGIMDADYYQPIFAFLLVFANAGHCLRLPYNMMILACGHYKQTQKNYIIVAVVNISISILAVKKWGLIGVAMGTLVAMIYQTIWMAYYNSKNFIKWPIRNFFRQSIIDIITIGVLIFIIRNSVILKILDFNVTNYFALIILAIKVGVIACINTLMINLIFYKSNIMYIIKRIRKCVVNKEKNAN